MLALLEEQVLSRKRLLLVLGWAAQAGVRIWLSHRQAVPLANPDESAYLITARMLAGGPSTDISGSTLYPVGYPLLITPVFWFFTSPVLAYHAVLVVNALVSALIVPLGYIACLRLGLSWRLSFAVAMVTGLLPAALFYSQYAMADAIFPVVVLAWLLTAHSWLTARGQDAFVWAAASAVLAGYAFACHARGLVILACYGLLGVLMLIRRMVPRITIGVAALSLLVTCATATMLNRHVSAILYSRGARSLSSQALTRLHSVHGVTLIVEMAGGQIWRLILDSWGVAGAGLAAALVVVFRRGLATSQVRLIAGLAVVVTIGIALSSPAALPSDQQQTWASGRYLDCMIVVFFLAGATALLRCAPRQVLVLAAAVLPVAVLTAAFVVGYAGSRLPINSFGPAFNFAVPALLTKDWAQPSVTIATLVVVGLLALWALISIVPWQRLRAPALLAGLALVSLFAASEMTEQVSFAYTAPAKSSATGLTATGSLKPGEQIAIGKTVGWPTWIPQAYEIWWTSPQFFNPASGAPPAGVTVVEVPLPSADPAGSTASFTSSSGTGMATGSATSTSVSSSSSSGSSSSSASASAATGPQASWPDAPAGWHIAAINSVAGWVVWRSS